MTKYKTNTESIIECMEIKHKSLLKHNKLKLEVSAMDENVVVIMYKRKPWKECMAGERNLFTEGCCTPLRLDWVLTEYYKEASP